MFTDNARWKQQLLLRMVFLAINHFQSLTTMDLNAKKIKTTTKMYFTYIISPTPNLRWGADVTLTDQKQKGFHSQHCPHSAPTLALRTPQGLNTSYDSFLYTYIFNHRTHQKFLKSLHGIILKRSTSCNWYSWGKINILVLTPTDFWPSAVVSECFVKSWFKYYSVSS